MSKVVALMSMSLDGYVADPDDGVADVFAWYFNSGDVEFHTGGADTIQQLLNAGLLDEIQADEALHRHSAENLANADALLLGRLMYEMEPGLIDEYEFVVHPRLAGHGPTLFAGLSKRIDLKLVSRLEFGSGAVAMRYEPRR